MNPWSLEDSIVAIATPSGRGAIAIVRASGSGVLQMLGRICPELGGSTPSPRTQRLLRVHHPTTGELIDRALVSCFFAPASYTGEDSIEIHTHGGRMAPKLVLDALLDAGARLALPGEFTRRALLHGKLDLLQAEAVLDLVEGSSPALHRAAIHQMERGLSARIEALRTGILQLEAAVAYAIDFPDEDEPPATSAAVRSHGEAVMADLDQLIRTIPTGELLREGALVVLAGHPNSGKSSLFNALLGIERSIVTEIPGTTRDAVEAQVNILGFPFRLVDTAGLRDSDDPVETMGIEVARRYIASADVVLFCRERDRPLDQEERTFLSALEGRRTILLRTKADLASSAAGAAVDDGLRVSASSGEGLNRLSEHLVRVTFEDSTAELQEAPLVTRPRHAKALVLARDEMDTFVTGLAAGLSAEIAATHLHGAAAALAELIGWISDDDVLSAVFSQFCVGK